MINQMEISHTSLLEMPIVCSFQTLSDIVQVMVVSGYPLIHTHLRGEQLTRDDLTDLMLLKLDAIAVVQSQINGFPGRVHLGYLNPKSRESDEPWILEEVPSVYDWPEDFEAFILDLESQFSKEESVQNIDPQSKYCGGCFCWSVTEAQASSRLKDWHTQREWLLSIVLQIRRPDGRFLIERGNGRSDCSSDATQQ